MRRARSRTTRSFRLVALAAAFSLVAVACGDGDGEPEATDDPEETVTDESADEPDDAADEPEVVDEPDDGADDPPEPAGDATTVTFWSWVPDIEMQIELFEAANPDIIVDHVNVGVGGEQYTQLRTAIRAGDVPDVAQIEFEALPSFIIADALVDLREQGADDLDGVFAPGVWGAVQGEDGQIYSYPWDSGPMAMLYREDLFEEHGIDVPETWDEFAQAARDINASDPEVFLTNFNPQDPSWWWALVWQAGSRPFEAEGETLTIDIDDEPSQRVADYWGELVADGVVPVDAPWTNDWYAGFNSGRYATWITAAWGPSFLQGVAEDTEGLWRAAPMPQWSSGENASSNWGGSSIAVMQGTEVPEAAERLARFLTSDPEAAQMFASEQLLFPATVALLDSDEFRNQEPAFYGGQQVFDVFAASSEAVDPSWQFAPIQDSVNQFLTDAVGPRLDSGDLRPFLAELEERTRTFAEEQGFQVP